MSDSEGFVPLEELLNAMSGQLDRAQAALALKAQNTALTFAVKELSLDLRAQVEIKDAAIHVRPALAGEQGVSNINIAYTTVTRPMLEENAIGLQAQEPSITDEVDDLSDEEQRRLEWLGIRNLSELNRLKDSGGTHEIKRLARIPTDRLKRALSLAGQRSITDISADPIISDSAQPLDPATRFRLRVKGRNLLQSNRHPHIDVNGKPARLLSVQGDHMIIETEDDTTAGTLSLTWPDGGELYTEYNLDDSPFNSLYQEGSR